MDHHQGSHQQYHHHHHRVSHQCAPQRGPCGAQRRVLPKGGVHEATHQAKTGTCDLEDAEDQHPVLVEDEVPVPSHESQTRGGSQGQRRLGAEVCPVVGVRLTLVSDLPGCVKKQKQKRINPSMKKPTKEEKLLQTFQERRSHCGESREAAFSRRLPG